MSFRPDTTTFKQEMPPPGGFPKVRNVTSGEELAAFEPIEFYSSDVMFVLDSL